MTTLPAPLVSDIADGRCLPFIGAGFSLNAKLPDGKTMPDWLGLAASLAGDARTLPNTPPQKVAERYEQLFGRVQLVEAIRKALHLDEAKPGECHVAFADLPFDTVYTTNFDLLLEDAYAQKGRPFRSLVGELQMPFHAGRLGSTVIKMHGDLRHEEHMIVAERDYAQYLKRYPVIATHLSAMLITRTPLYIGYSLTDPDFIQIRKVIRSRLGEFERMSFLIQFDKTPAEIERVLKNNIHIISLETSSGKSKDVLLQELFRETLGRLDTQAGINLRTSRPDVFEEVEPEIVDKAVHSRQYSTILTTTSKLCFVMMPFANGFDEIYARLIKPTVERFGLEVVRADEILAAGAIMEQIRAAIQQSRLCIADLTGKNPNVLYELGIAQTMVKPTILLSQSLEDVPFDVAAQRIIVYGEDYRTVQSSLEETIKRVLIDDQFEEAQRMVGAGLYRAAIAVIGVIIEHHLRQMILEVDTTNQTLMSSIQMTQILQSKGVITQEDAAFMRDVIRLRNKAVHDIAELSIDDAQFVLSTVKSFVERHPI